MISKINIYNESLACFLTENIEYSDGKSNYILLTKKPPFNSFKVGDFIVINTGEIINYPKHTVMVSENTVSKQKGF